MKPEDVDDKPISMHENVQVWCDCCSCEAEPYWQEVAGELGIDLDTPVARQTADNQ